MDINANFNIKLIPNKNAMDKFDCLQLFIRVSHLGSFTAAANELNVTQSSVSKKIAWLEHKVGIALFHRNNRAIQLTAQGYQYLQYSEKTIDEMAHFESSLKDELKEVKGHLKLSVPSTIVTQLLIRPISDFMTLHPDLTIDTSVNDRQVDLIENNIDIAIRASVLEDSGYKARFLFNNHAIYFASPGYLRDKAVPTLLSDLQSHDCLTYSLMSPSNVWSFHNNDKTDTKVVVREVFKSDSPELLLKMALLGHGIAALPNWMVEDYLKNGSLIQVLGSYQTMTLPMYAVFKNDDYQPYRIRAFVDYLLDYFQSLANDNRHHLSRM